jgi:hypothetical protein
MINANIKDNTDIFSEVIKDIGEWISVKNIGISRNQSTEKYNSYNC